MAESELGQGTGRVSQSQLYIQGSPGSSQDHLTMNESEAGAFGYRSEELRLCPSRSVHRR